MGRSYGRSRPNNSSARSYSSSFQMLLVERRIISNQTPGGGTAEALTCGTFSWKEEKISSKYWRKSFLPLPRKTSLPGNRKLSLPTKRKVAYSRDRKSTRLNSSHV